MKTVLRVLSLSLALVLLFLCTSCGAKPQTVVVIPVELPRMQAEAPKPGADFAEALSIFELNFFREMLYETYAAGTTANTMVSPLSAAVALAMLENGAAGSTLAEMETMFGMSREAFVSGLSGYVSRLSSGDNYRVACANSVWLRDTDDLSVKESFLAANRDAFGAEVYARSFDGATRDEINFWCSDKTNGLIPKVIDRITPDMMLFLVNALYFKAEWETPYEKPNCRGDVFHNADKTDATVPMLFGSEHVYLSGDGYTGFAKPYAGGHYAFVALLPDGDLYDFVADMTGADWVAMWKNRSSDYDVSTMMPEFSADCAFDLLPCLEQLGVHDAFSASAADFSALATLPGGNLYVGTATQNTAIRVTAKGTEAAAVTVIGMKVTSAEPEARETRVVHLDRPFLYAVVETGTGTPLFLGVVTQLSGS